MSELSDYFSLFIFVTKEKDGMIMHTLEIFIYIYILLNSLKVWVRMLNLTIN